MDPPAPEPGPFCIRWQTKMSYINEALKKAQKDKDAERIGYMHSIGKSGRAKNSFDIRFIFLIFIIFLLLVLLIYPRFGNQAGQEIKNSAGESSEIPVPDKQNDKKNIPVIENQNRPKEDIIEKNSNDIIKITQREMLYKQAVLLIKDNKIDEAKNIYLKILIEDPGHINSLNDMGVLFLHEGRYEDAIRYLEKAVKLKPKFANPFYNLACAYSLQNEGEKGMAYLLKAIEVDENVKNWAKQDPDLQNLKGYAEFTLITK